MQTLHQSLQGRLAQSVFQRALVLDSTESADRLSGDVYATVDASLVSLELVSRGPQRWCEILLLLSNTKNCRVEHQNEVAWLQIQMGTKGPQELSSTTPMGFRYQTSAPKAPVLETELRASAGPMGTKDGMLRLYAIAVSDQKSFVHLHYSYRNSLAGSLATSVYLQTLGRGKVGFSKDPGASNESTRTTDAHWVGGVRGIIERNTMRYFMALSCALQFAAVEGPSQRFAQMAPCWYDETENYPLQLHEMPRQAYLDMKRAEFGRPSD
jgi:hypothetical protein